MRRESSGPVLTTIFVDYDNIYLSLRRKSEEAARRFAKDASLWLRELETGRLITPTNGLSPTLPRRIVMNRCYGNPVPRRNNSDNSTDMNSFPFVRHHFLRSGFEVIDCPPLTAQLKNSSDIRMVMDVRDLLGHDTYFDEFIILSGDADFTPVLHRLRAHARRTVIFANDHTAAPYTSISDGEVREADLISLLLEGRIGGEAEPNNQIEQGAETARVPSITQIEVLRRELVGEVAALVRQSGQPVPLEALADRLVRTLGHDKTAGSGWGGTGSFRELLSRALPGELRMSSEPPYYVFDAALSVPEPAPLIAAPPAAEPAPRLNYAEPRFEAAAPQPPQRLTPTAPVPSPQGQNAIVAPQRAATAAQLGQSPLGQSPLGQSPLGQSPPGPMSYGQPPASQLAAAQHPVAQSPGLPAASSPPARTAPIQPPTAPVQRSQLQPAPQAAPAPPRVSDAANAIQQSIARIHEACQAPPLSPPEYRALFEAMAQEINGNGLTGAQTLVNIGARAHELGIDIRRDDIRFVLEVVSEADPWFEQGASAVLFSSRFRNFVVARCRSQGLNLSSDELDLIEAWFAGTAAGAGERRAPVQQQALPQRAPAEAPAPQQPAAAAGSGDRWWGLDEGRQHVAETRADRFGAPADGGGDEFPRFVRKGLRG